MEIEKVLVTCALPYVNNVPHIGNIAGSHLPADVFARFCRLAGCETVFIGGSDEHGTPSEVSAERLGISPQELCDSYYRIHKDIYDWLEISYDNFSRTSLPEHHETTKAFFLEIYEKGFIEEGVLKLPFCPKCSRVLPDRYVEGICPKCGFEGARGDQCESCSTLLNPDELVKPYCVICHSKPEIRETKHLFLKLDELEKRLEEWIEGKKGLWSGQVLRMALGWIKEGLKPRCITRDIKWGVKVPVKGFEDKVLYVWFDAPIGYISSTKEWAKTQGRPGYWTAFWKDPKTKIVQFIGKDNIPFHTIFFPGMLLAHGGYNLPHIVAGLQYLNYEGGKISKSKGWGVFCENLPDSGIDPDIWRFYLTFVIPETDDTQWKWDEFQERVNNELVANLGNFVYRTLSFVKNNFDGAVPEGRLDAGDRELLELGRENAEEIKELMWGIKLRDSLRKVLELSDKGNKYFQENAPWKAVKEDPERAKAALYVCANLCYDLAVLVSPFLPASAEKIAGQLGIELGGLETAGTARVKAGTKMGDISPLFPKIEDSKIAQLKKEMSRVTHFEEMFKKREVLGLDEFSKLDLRVAKIIEVEEVKGARKLLKLKVEVGGEKRQLVAGIREQYNKKELLGKTVVVLANLRPAVIKGEKSEGMLLAAVDGEKISILSPEKPVKSGSRVR